MDFELGRWYGPFALRDLWQTSLKRRAAIVTSKNDHVHHHQPQDKEKGREEMMELWESLGFVPNVAFVWFSLVLLLNLDWTENGSTFWKRYFMIITIIVIYQQCLWFFLGIFLLKSLSFGSLWWLLPSILGILFPLCTGDIYLYICLHASCLQ